MIADATVLGANKTKVAAKYGISRETLYKYVAGNAHA
jgi:DNA-binding phage protein